MVDLVIDYAAYVLYMIPAIIMCLGLIFIGSGILFKLGVSREMRQQKQVIQQAQYFYFSRGCLLAVIGILGQIPAVMLTYPLLPPLNQDVVAFNIVIIGFLLYTWIQQARLKRLEQNS